MKTKLNTNDSLLKNILYPLSLLFFLTSCNEKPVVVDDARNHPEFYKKVDSVKQKPVLQVLKQDVYLNDLDPNAGMEIESRQINMFYRSEQDSINDYYGYVVDQTYNGKNYKDEGVSYLHLIKNGDSLHYQILANDRNYLRFKFMGDQSIHEYFPAKRPGKPPIVVPN